MLPKLEGFAAALFESLDAPALSTVADELASLEQTILARADLRAVMSDTSITGVARGLIVHDLLDAKVQPTTQRVVVFAAQNVPAQEVDRAIAELATAAHVLKDTGTFAQASLGLLAARQRVGGFADALLDEVDTSNFDEIEDELFRWARTVESNLELRRLLLDRDAALEARLGTVRQLLTGKVNDITLRLCLFTIEGGRPRDVVGTLDFLVDYVARARDWRVARVRSARDLDEMSRTALAASLHSLTGKNVELQVTDEPSLLGGVLVDVGDLHLDATTQGRLSELHEAVAGGRFYDSALTRND
jgi:F-type H+-transporting ATPase subunit delta